MTTTSQEYGTEPAGFQAVLARSITAKRAGTLKRVSDVSLAQYLIDGPLSGVVKAEGEFWCYTGSCWEPIPKHELSQLVQGLDGKKYRVSRTKFETLAISASRIDGVLQVLGDRLTQPDFFNTQLPGINCENGFVVFDPQGNPTLEAHAQSHRRQHVLLGNWTPDAGHGQRVRDCLMRNFLGDEDAEQKLDLLAEAAGVAALGLGGSKDGKALVFVGEAADNGKSTILDLIKAGLPAEAGTALPPSKFNHDHHAVLLRGKLLNAVAELGTAGVIASDAFKKMITGDEFAARGLYRDTFTYRPRAQHIFVCNAMPTFQGGIDRGVLRQLLILQSKWLRNAERGLNAGPGAERAGQACNSSPSVQHEEPSAPPHAFSTPASGRRVGAAGAPVRPAE
jgi:hypothetical protein